MSAPDAKTAARWRQKGLDPRYGPRWYLHKDGRPPEEDECAYVWNVAAQCWQRDWEYEEERGNDF